MRSIATLAAAAVALVATPLALADGTSTVSVFGCFVNGGHTTRPAGTELVARTGWAAKTRGLVQEYLQAQTTTFGIDDGEPADVGSAYEAPAVRAGGDWASFVNVPTGVVLAPGTSVTLTFTIAVSHRVTDGELFADDDRSKPLFFEPRVPTTFSCTVTGA